MKLREFYPLYGTGFDGRVYVKVPDDVLELDWIKGRAGLTAMVDFSKVFLYMKDAMIELRDEEWGKECRLGCISVRNVGDLVFEKTTKNLSGVSFKKISPVIVRLTALWNKGKRRAGIRYVVKQIRRYKQIWYSDRLPGMGLIFMPEGKVEEMACYTSFSSNYLGMIYRRKGRSRLIFIRSVGWPLEDESLVEFFRIFLRHGIFIELDHKFYFMSQLPSYRRMVDFLEKIEEKLGSKIEGMREELVDFYIRARLEGKV